MKINIGRFASGRFLSKISLSKVESLLDFKKFTKPAKTLPPFSGQSTVGVCSVALTSYKNIKEYIEHMESFVVDAVEKNCDIVVFPQYSGLLPLAILTGAEEIIEELLALHKADKLDAALEFSILFENFGVPVYDCYYNVMSLLALKHRIHIHAGSTIVPTKQGHYNQALIFDTNGNSICPQNKILPNTIESNFHICCGESIESYETPFGCISTVIGEDQHKFEIFKVARNLGSKIMLVPDGPLENCNELSGLRGAPMRVQESNCAAARSVLVGDFAGHKFTGKSGIYVPYNYEGAENGVLCETLDEQKDHLVAAKIDTGKLITIKELYASDVNQDFYLEIWKDYLGN